MNEDPLQLQRTTVNERLAEQIEEAKKNSPEHKNLCYGQTQTVARRAILDGILAGAEEREAELRSSAALLEDLCCRVLISSVHSALRRRQGRTLARLSRTLAVVGSSGGGGALLSGVSTAWSQIVGGLILAVGLIGGIVQAFGGEQQYELNRTKRRAYDALWWEAWNYAIYSLIAKTQAETEAALREFGQRRATIGLDQQLAAW